VLKSELIEPGFHFRVPGMQQVIRMDLMIQTDKVERVPCGTANGLLITFDKIEVVNRLERRQVYRTVLNYTEEYEKIWITDKIHHEINQFCSKHTLQEIYIDLFDRLDEELMKALSLDLKKWAPGIEILSVRVTKPTIPKKILQNVEQMEKVKIEYLIAVEKERTVVEERKTNQSQARIKAEADLSVKRI
jgi:erlin